MVEARRYPEGLNPNAHSAVVNREFVHVLKGAIRSLRKVGYFYKVTARPKGHDKSEIIVVGNPRRLDPALEIMDAFISPHLRGSDLTERAQRAVNRIMIGFDELSLQRAMQPYRR